MQIIYQKSFSLKKRRAIGFYVAKVNNKVEFSSKPRATEGPEGQVLVECVFDIHSNSKEKAIQRLMAKTSRQVLDSSGIWIVGIPMRSLQSPHKSPVSTVRK